MTIERRNVRALFWLGSIGLAVGVTLLMLASITLARPRSASAAAGASLPAETDPCVGVTAIPESECRALAELYRDTGGPNWITATHWLVTTDAVTPCDWYGVTCAGGRVTGLSLSANRLTGSLPRSLTDLSHLTALRLDNNRLRGLASPAICALTDTVTTADFAYNSLETRNRTARLCMDQLDPDWANTQTVAPRDLAVTAITSTTVDLTWTPIFYQEDGGYYEVGVATAGINGPYTVHGRTADKTAASYRVDGLKPGRTYYIRVRTVTPAHDEQPDELTSEGVQTIAVTRAPGQTILLAVYFPADNNLAPYLAGVVERLRLGTTFNPNVQVVFLGDGRDEDDTKVLVMAGGVVTRTNAVVDRWGASELDTADPAVLAWFLDYARTSHPAARMLVSLMGHGVGLSPEIEPASGSARKKLPPLPQGHDFTPGDVTDNSYMSTVELGRALMQATNDGANPFDLLFFDQCFQGNLDVLYEVRNAAQVFIASPNYAWFIAAYGKYLTQLAPVRTAEEIAEAIIQLYQNSLNNRHPNAIFWASRTDITAIAGAVNGLAEALIRALRAGEDGRILTAAEGSQFVDTSQCQDQRFSLGPPDELIGAGSFAEQLQARFGAGDAYGVHTAAGTLLTALESVHSTARTGSPWIAPDMTWQYEDTLTILAPLRRDTPAETVWRASIYTATAPVQAVWTISPTHSVVISNAFASTRDGLWDDFLAEWYTDLSPTVGQWCRYIPPALTVDDEAETLALEAREGADGPASVRLTWQATNEENAEAYWLFRRAPGDIQWGLLAVLPLEQTSYSESNLTEGEHRYMTAVRSAAGVFVGRSNETAWVVGERSLYLPVVGR